MLTSSKSKDVTVTGGENGPPAGVGTKEATATMPSTVVSPLRTQSFGATGAVPSTREEAEHDTVVVSVAAWNRSSSPSSAAQGQPAKPEDKFDVKSKEFCEKMAIDWRDRTKNMHILSEVPSRVTQQLAGMDNYYVSISDPRDSSVRGVKKSPLFLAPYLIIRKFYTQIAAFLLYLVCVIMVLVQCFGGGGSTNWFTFILTLAFALEMTVLVLFQQLSYRLALWDRYWRCAELVIVAVGLILEIAGWATWGSQGNSGGFRAVAWVRLLIFWLPHGKTRWEQLQYGVRTLTSADRRRYVGEGYDLDYSYVHRNVAAMGWPACNFERFFRNAMEDVAGFLDRKHPNSYLVVNLCSERTYSPTYFHNQTSWYPLDDHNPGELELMLAFARESADFIAEDPNSRVVVINCKGGKGRTGTFCCAYLLFVGIKRTADDALQHFSLLRTKDGASAFQGVQAPSQERYIRYFEKLLTLSNLMPPDRSLRVRGLRLKSVPWLWYSQDAGKLWFAVLTKPCTERQVVFLSNGGVQFNAQVPDPSTYTRKQLRDLFSTDEDNLYKESNEVDPADATDENGGGGAAQANAVGAHGYRLDKSSFWFYVNSDYGRRLSYEEFYTSYGSGFAESQTKAAERTAAGSDGSVAVRSVSLEFKEPERIPVLSGDVVFKFFFARNNPNPLEPPVQFWLHPSFESDETITLTRNQIDGPPKDKKAERYPADFSIELDAEYLVPETQNGVGHKSV